MDWITDVVRTIAELPDRNSLEDQPEMMLVSADELRAIIISHAQAETLELPACPRCGDADTHAAAPDWTDAGIAAEMTCPRCEHAWTARWVLTPNP